MGSPLENIPSDVLQYISVLAVSSTPFDPPVEVLHLLQTGPVIYQALNIRSAPHIYARIFASKFDTAAIFRRYSQTITDSALAAELLNRCRLLKRCKRGDVSARGLLKDLSTALWMYLESDGRNELQLLNVGFPDYILSVARTHLKGALSRETYDLQSTLIGRIVIWLLCLALSRRFIFNIPDYGRKELYALIFPYVLSSERTIPSFNPCPNCSTIGDCLCSGRASNNLFAPYVSMQSPGLNGRGLRVPAYRLTLAIAGYIPNPSIAAGNLANVIFESEGMKMPPHLRETREIPVQVIVPTKSDFKAFAAYETHLFADSLIPGDSDVIDTSGTRRSALHDLEFRQLMVRTPLDASYPKIGYILGSMTAVWEGVFRTIDAPAGSAATNGLHFFSVLKPIQCALNEYVNDEHTSTNGHIEKLSLSDIFLTQDGSELYAKGRKYRRHDANSNAPMSEPAVQHVILYGETLENHDHAWGGYKFWGLVDEDGKVALRRSAKTDDISHGVWEFDGRLRFGSVFMGRWRVSDDVYHGIFSMTRM